MKRWLMAVLWWVAFYGVGCFAIGFAAGHQHPDKAIALGTLAVTQNNGLLLVLVTLFTVIGTKTGWLPGTRKSPRRRKYGENWHDRR